MWLTFYKNLSNFVDLSIEVNIVSDGFNINRSRNKTRVLTALLIPFVSMQGS